MTAAEDARKRYLAERERFAAAAAAMKELLTGVCQRAGVLARIEAREKTPASFVKKIHQKGYEEPWAQMTDKVGARVIAETRTDLSKIIVELRRTEALTILTEEDKRATADPGTLFYPGVHMQVVVPDRRTAQDEPIECEVQLRTKAEDLWSVPSHKLLYKAPVEPSREAARRVWRLSVLVEMFDEEVERAMTEAAASPGYRDAVLARIAESLYFTFVSEPGEELLTLDVVEIVGRALAQDERDDYERLLSTFVESHRSKLTRIYADYGCYSAFAEEADYWLFTQPESLIVFERIENRPMLLREVTQDTEIAYAITPLFQAWGQSYD